MRRMKKGFTLIELLVVIAIIGILSSVVLASLSSARTKGADAAIKSSASSFMSEAEILYGSGSPFTETLPYGNAVADGNCSTASTIFTHTVGANIIKNAYTNANVAITALKCNSNGTEYALEIPLRTTALGPWCVDSTGFVGKGTSAAGTYKCI